jgi:hypothetical protein
VTRRRPDAVPRRASVSHARVPVCLTPAVWPPAVRPFVNRPHRRRPANAVTPICRPGYANLPSRRLPCKCKPAGCTLQSRA